MPRKLAVDHRAAKIESYGFQQQDIHQVIHCSRGKLPGKLTAKGMSFAARFGRILTERRPGHLLRGHLGLVSAGNDEKAGCDKGAANQLRRRQAPVSCRRGGVVTNRHILIP